MILNIHWLRHWLLNWYSAYILPYIMIFYDFLTDPLKQKMRSTFNYIYWHNFSCFTFFPFACGFFRNQRKCNFATQTHTWSHNISRFFLSWIYFPSLRERFKSQDKDLNKKTFNHTESFNLSYRFHPFLFLYPLFF